MDRERKRGYFDTMKRDFFIATLWLLGIFLILPSFSAQAGAQECALMNTEFCGEWGGKDGRVDISARALNWKWYGVGGHNYSSCSVVKEERFADGRPVTILKCIERYNPHLLGVKPSLRPSGYLMVMQPKLKYVSDGISMKMHFFWGELEMSGPCLSDQKSDREFCDLLAFAKESEKSGSFSLHPLY